MRGPPVSHCFPRRAHLSARHRRVAATRLHRAASHARLKGAVGTAHRCLDSRLPTAPSHVPRSDSATTDRLATCATDRACPSTPTPPSTPSDAPVSTPRRRVLAPPRRANPLHCRPRRSPPGRPTLASKPRHAARRCHLHPQARPRRRPCAGEAPPCFPRPPLMRRPSWARPRPSRTRLGRARCAGQLRRHCATGPREDSPSGI
jgi:hypothetical protein